jgi:ribonuclease III
VTEFKRLEYSVGLIEFDYVFKQNGLRLQALTHRSKGPEHNERLEYLGDALLGLIVAEYLYGNFPTADEGQLTRARAALVNSEVLTSIANRLRLGKELLLGDGEKKSGGSVRSSILSDSIEALIGAVYLDSDYAKCRNIVCFLYEDYFSLVNPLEVEKDAKTELQESLQALNFGLPLYTTIDVTGPPHSRTFFVTCTTKALEKSFKGHGTSRRKAEQLAARFTLNALKGQTSNEK